MSNPHAPRISGDHALSWMVKGLVLPGLVYPLWHLAAPDGATDPWFVWFLVGGASVTVGLLPLRVAFVAEHLPAFFYATIWLVALQFFALATVNEMSPFYAVGSVMTYVMAGAVIRSMPGLLAYAIFVTVLAATSWLIDPMPLKVAFWGPAPMVLSTFYFRLSLQVTQERMLAEHQKQLETRVAQRTEALSLRTEQLSAANAQLLLEGDERRRLEDKMRLSQKMEAVGRLAGGVAHDFNNLLTAIRGYGDLVLGALAPASPLRDDVAQIIKAGDQASDLTQRLLAFSRKHPTETGVFDVNGVIEEMAPMLQTVLGEDVEIVYALSDSPAQIRGNRNQVEQVLLNLALNARDAMPAGGKLSFETSLVDAGDVESDEPLEETAPDGYVRVVVSDTGVGMDAETQARIFDPFFTTKSVDEGTGLGLSTAYGTIKQAGGHIRVLSEPRRGARFELYIPQAIVVAEEEATPTAPRVEHGRNERLLLVEDDADVRQLFRRVLRTGGYAVREARSAREAVDLIMQGEEFDLLVTDVVMPGMSGIELADRVREVRPNAGILFVSGHRRHMSLHGRPLSADARILAKPVSPAELLAGVRNLLDVTATRAT